MKIIALGAAIALAGFVGAAQSAVVYDESINGDATGNVVAGTNIGTLGGSMTSVILGSYNAGLSGPSNGPDEQDSFTFSVLGDFTVDVATSNGDDALYLLYRIVPFSFLASGGPGIDLFGTNGAGTYSVTLVGNGNEGKGTYEISINVGATQMPAVPLPAAAPLLLAGLGGLGVFARRKRRAAA
ncbi:MAG: VPLPA-CTERM sorting domain-containing protein [Pseudooceanicola sp.]